jgi:hypothetical protein
MNDVEFRGARLAFLADGQISVELLGELRAVVTRLLAFGNLPPMYSPTGRWDEDAEEEVFGDWGEARLIGGGQLAALMHQAGTARSFGRLGELYLRRHLINRLERTHATNLFGRLRTLLGDETTLFAVLIPSTHDQDVVWTQVGDGAPAVAYGGGEDQLLSLAWGLGEFETVRFREDARKLSHVLERDELIRFVTGLIAAGEGGLTLAQIVATIVTRFDLQPAHTENLGEEAEAVASADDVVEEVSAAQLAVAVLAELSARQVEILAAQLQHESVRTIAETVHASVGTVSSEQQRSAAVLSRLSDPDHDSRSALLNALRDLLF